MSGGCDYLLPFPPGTLNRAPHPITLLPPEILSEIMCYLPLFVGRDAPSIHPLDRDLDPSRRFTRDGPIRTPHWVAVSHVSRRWRETALKCKALWTCVPLVSVSWARRALALSHPHPLTLHIDSKDTSLDRGYVSVDALCLALTHAERIRKIRMHAPWGTRHGDRIMDVVFSALYRGAAQLEELDLAPDPPFLARGGRSSGPADTAADLGALRVMRLEQCYFLHLLPADCPLFHAGLSHLRLAGSRAVWPALEPLLDTLARVPRLRVLELYGVLPTTHSSPPPPRTASSSAAADRNGPLLPLLLELHIGGTPQGVLAVLQALELSEGVRVFVSLPGAPAEDGSPSRLLAKLRGKQGMGPEQSHTSH